MTTLDGLTRLVRKEKRKMGIMKITEDREHRDLKLYGDGPVTLSINGEAVELTDLGLSISDRNKFSRRSFKNPFVDLSFTCSSKHWNCLKMCSTFIFGRFTGTFEFDEEEHTAVWKINSIVSVDENGAKVGVSCSLVPAK